MKMQLWKRKSTTRTWLIPLAAAGAVAALLGSLLPDIVRYVRIHRM
jgi:hypothetical protein